MVYNINMSYLGSILPITRGGTGANNAEGAKSSLNLPDSPDDLTYDVSAKSADYTIVTESLVVVTTGAEVVAITLPSAGDRGDPITVILGTDGGASCTVDDGGGIRATLDDAGDSVTFMSDGNSWHLIGSYGTPT